MSEETNVAAFMSSIGAGGSTVSGNAHIQDHATIVKGTVSGGTVGALSLVGLTTTPANAFNISGSATVKTTFMPLGFFESGQSVSGSASLIGDVEFRGVGFTETAGTFFLQASRAVSLWRPRARPSAG